MERLVWAVASRLLWISLGPLALNTCTDQLYSSLRQSMSKLLWQVIMDTSKVVHAQHLGPALSARTDQIYHSLGLLAQLVRAVGK